MKRHKSAAGVPILAERMCVGDHAVPLEIVDIGASSVHVVDISPSAEWLVLVFGWKLMPKRSLLHELKLSMQRQKAES